MERFDIRLKNLFGFKVGDVLLVGRGGWEILGKDGIGRSAGGGIAGGLGGGGGRGLFSEFSV